MSISVMNNDASHANQLFAQADGMDEILAVIINDAQKSRQMAAKQQLDASQNKIIEMKNAADEMRKASLCSLLSGIFQGAMTAGSAVCGAIGANANIDAAAAGVSKATAARLSASAVTFQGWAKGLDAAARVDVMGISKIRAEDAQQKHQIAAEKQTQAGQVASDRLSEAARFQGVMLSMMEKISEARYRGRLG